MQCPKCSTEVRAETMALEIGDEEGTIVISLPTKDIRQKWELAKKLMDAYLAEAE